MVPAVPRLREPMDRLIAWMMLTVELSRVIARLRLAPPFRTDVQTV